MNDKTISTQFGLKKTFEMMSTRNIDIYSIIDEDVIIKASKVKKCIKDINLNGCICLHTNNTALDVLIKNVTDSLFTHVSTLILDNKTKKLILTESLPSEVKTHEVANLFFHDTNKDMDIIFDRIAEVRGNSDIKMILVPNERIEDNRYYDRYSAIRATKPVYEKGISTIAKFLIPMKIRKLFSFKETKDSFFCSEYVLDIVRGVDCIKGFTNSDFSPGDFFRPSVSKSIYANTSLFKKLIIDNYTPYLVNKKDSSGVHVLYEIIDIEKIK